MIVQWAIFVVLVLILAVLVYYSITSPGGKIVIPPTEKEPKSLELMASIMKEAKDEKEREERERDMVAYAKKKYKGSPIPPRISGEDSDRPVNVKAHIMVPYNLSEIEKQILEEFYR